MVVISFLVVVMMMMMMVVVMVLGTVGLLTANYLAIFRKELVWEHGKLSCLLRFESQNCQLSLNYTQLSEKLYKYVNEM